MFRISLWTDSVLPKASFGSAGVASAAGGTLGAVMICRAAVGLGEGVILPSMSSLLAVSIPPSQRSSALGNAFTGFHAGNLVGLAATPFLLQVRSCYDAVKSRLKNSIRHLPCHFVACANVTRHGAGAGSLYFLADLVCQFC